MTDTITIHTRFQHRRGTAARWAEVNPILRDGELGLETDTRRFKFGDGVSAWNDLEYCTKELLPASATETGGVKANAKKIGDTVEVRIDPLTQRLYVPSYPVIPQLPTLARVATSNDYNDLDNLPTGYILPAATANQIGGIAAAAKTSDYTVEVKKDPSSHKLFVPQTSGGNYADTNEIPGIVVRVVYRHQSRSQQYVNEPEAILNADIFFRPQCSPEHFNQIKDGLFISLARCNSRRRKLSKTNTQPAGTTKRKTGWHIVGDWEKIDPAYRYPQKSTFSLYDFFSPCWCAKHTPPVNISSLIGSYQGEWIKFPYDLETIVRRFIYLYKINNDTGTQQNIVLPMGNLKDAVISPGYIKVSGIRKKTDLYPLRTSKSDYYASLNIGFCFCRAVDNPPHLRHTILGQIEHKRAIVVRKQSQDLKTFYYLKDPQNRPRFRK